MAENTKIAWCDHTFNCWVGCVKVSEACKNCYAEGWAKRTGQPQLWQGERRRTSAANWKLPLKWNKEAALKGERARVFCASLADIFEDHSAIMPSWRADLGQLILETPNLDWLLLTKRPENIYRMLPDFWVNFTEPYGLPRNVWLGTTVESQQRAEERIPHLLRVSASVHFLSCEPLLGPLDLSGWLEHAKIDQVIVGGESGKGYRSMNLDWARDIRDQCVEHGVAFFFKQESGFKPGTNPLLDGQQWHQMPQLT